MIVGTEVLEDGTLLISYYETSGKISHIKKRIPDQELFNWVESSVATAQKNWDGTYIKKSPTRGNYLTQFRIQEIIKDRLSDSEKKTIYDSESSPKKVFLDIEIQLTDDSFPEASEAKMPVCLISFCNEQNVTYILSTLKDDLAQDLTSEDISKMESEVKSYFKSIVPLDPADTRLFNQDFSIKYKFFTSEIDMLNFFFHKLAPQFSLVSGWNVTEYDWKYLMNRAKNLKIDATKTLLSRTTFSKNKIPLHLAVIDYMEIFEQLKPYKVIENYKLDYIAGLVLGANKLKHDYSSFFEFQKDVYLFTKYNVIDVLLVKLIEDKLSLFDVAYSMADVAQVELNRVFSPVYVSEILICREFLKNGLRMMKLPWEENSKDSEKYTGAYVKKPKPDYYKYVSCYDFSSMYPNIQIQFNISPDTYLGKKETAKVQGKVIHTKNETLFSCENDSVTRKILTRLYDERIKTQGEIKQLENKKNASV